MMDSQNELNDFAELLMRLVRDRAISTCEAFAAGRIGGPDGQRWNTVLAGGDARAAVTELIGDIVDQTLFYLLNAIDNGDLPLAWQRPDGTCAELYDLGRSELAGWFIGSPGWRSQYSTRPFFDPDAG
jgi:hypothetical protein